MKYCLFIILSVLAFNTYAENQYVCKSGSVERTITVVYESQTSKVPCLVRYVKPGSSEVLWSAENQEGYCESKAETFAARLTKLGWACSERAVEDKVSKK